MKFICNHHSRTIIPNVEPDCHDNLVYFQHDTMISASKLPRQQIKSLNKLKNMVDFYSQLWSVHRQRSRQALWCKHKPQCCPKCSITQKSRLLRYRSRSLSNCAASLGTSFAGSRLAVWIASCSDCTEARSEPWSLSFASRILTSVLDDGKQYSVSLTSSGILTLRTHGKTDLISAMTRSLVSRLRHTRLSINNPRRQISKIILRHFCHVHIYIYIYIYINGSE